MIERWRLLARSVAWRWPTWLIGALVLIDLAVRWMVGPDASITARAWTICLGTALSFAVSEWLGVHIQSLVLRPGASLIPGFRSQAIRAAAATWWLLMLPGWSTVAGQGGPLLLTIALALPAAFLGAWTGIALPMNSKKQGMSVLLGLGALLNVMGVVVAKLSGREQMPSWWIPGVDPLAQKVLLCAVGLAGLAGLGAWAMRSDLDAFLVRKRSQRAENPGTGSLDESPTWLLALLPSAARRKPVREVAQRVPSRSEAARAFRSTAGVMSALGMACMMSPFVVYFAWSMHRDGEALDNELFPMLFLLNGAFSLSVYYSRGRIAREALRPITRDELFDCFALALARDIFEYSIVILVLTCAVFAVIDGTLLSEIRFWGPFVLAPGFAALNYAITTVFLRWTRFGGGVGFVLTFPASIVLVNTLHDSAAEALLPWFLWGSLFLVASLPLLPLARRVWRDADLEPCGTGCS